MAVSAGPVEAAVAADAPVPDGAFAAADTTDRPLRADARRNRDQLLVTTAAVFAEKGVDAPLDEIARRANVGIGTLYRHFPTREALIEAVYRRELDLLCDGVDTLMAQSPPDVALSNWMRRFVEYVAKKRGMAMALKAVLGADSELFAYSHQRIRTALNTLVDSAVAAQTIRADVDSEDLLRAMSGICMATDAGWSDRASRLVDLLMDGLRYGAAEPSVSPATDGGTAIPRRKSGAGRAAP
jgi:AcrR family transcriptional regulator